MTWEEVVNDLGIEALAEFGHMMQVPNTIQDEMSRVIVMYRLTGRVRPLNFRLATQVVSEDEKTYEKVVEVQVQDAFGNYNIRFKVAHLTFIQLQRIANSLGITMTSKVIERV